jgi:arginyl-tRNA synthetase
MSNLTRIKQTLSTWTPQILLTNNLNIKTIWSIPTSPKHGILTTNIAFLVAKELRTNPIELAKSIIEDLQIFIRSQNLPFLISQAGPYINLSLENSFYKEFLKSELKFDDLVEASDQKLIIDYCSPNIAKDIHAGHTFNIDVGQALIRILKLKYKNLTTDCHLGDWGVNIGFLLWGWKNYDKSNFKKDSSLIEQLTESYIYANNLAKDNPELELNVRNEFIKLEQKDPENVNLWKELVSISIENIESNLLSLNAPKHDIIQGESYYEPQMAELYNFMESNNIWTSEGKARYIDFEELANRWQKEFPDSNVDFDAIKNFGRSYLVSSTGYTTYCFRDVATRFEYANTLGVDQVLVVVDKTQKHNFDQAITVISYLATLPSFQKLYPNTNTKLNWNKSDKSCIFHGFLKLPEGKMSTRAGNVLLIKDMLLEVETKAKEVLLAKTPDLSPEELAHRSKTVALAALRWNNLKQSYEQDVTFDINQVLKFEGNTGVYQLYTFARTQSLLKKLGELETSTADQNFDISELETIILSRVMTLSDTIDQICTKHQPYLMCNYLYELTNMFNKWYNDVPVLRNEQRRLFNIEFITKVNITLRFCLNHIGIEVLEKM